MDATTIVINNNGMLSPAQLGGIVACAIIVGGVAMCLIGVGVVQAWKGLAELWRKRRR